MIKSHKFTPYLAREAMAEKRITIHDFLSKEDIDKARKLYWASPSHASFARQCADEIITPQLPEINKKLGQQNDPLFLAYCVEYEFIQSQR